MDGSGSRRHYPQTRLGFESAIAKGTLHIEPPTIPANPNCHTGSDPLQKKRLCRLYTTMRAHENMKSIHSWEILNMEVRAI